MKLKIREPETQKVREHEVEVHGTFAVFYYPREAVNEWARLGVFPKWAKEIAESLEKHLGMSVIMVAEDVKVQVMEFTVDEREARRQVWEKVVSLIEQYGPEELAERMTIEAENDGFEKLEVRQS